ncbi:MAG: FAD-binding protein [Oscillospiraceae bacterium]|nr:FAD-binding protein [Oscillospiraceae bacterium]
MKNLKIIQKNTLIIGSGAAGLNAADRLYSLGQKNIALITEGLTKGTSRNTGSDKQTYYKLSLSGAEADSVAAMAETLFSGGAMDGDIALCEAAHSAQCFYRLAELGVPFPHNDYGEYVGYKTDHDPKSRAASAGPLTSKFMTERLLEQVKAKNIEIYDGYMAVKILVQNSACRGVICLNLNALNDTDSRFTVFLAPNIIYATGGPAGLYAQSVYPESQNGASGIAFEAGVTGKNLTEWQYGIASVKFRWNLSGTYQQVLPAYISTDPNGGGEREFLSEYFETDEQLLNAVFLKGYQWPFDPRKLENHSSSMIDAVVYHETTNKNRRVFLDYRKNPSALKKDFKNTGDECYNYLHKSNALFGTPVERLAHMNPAAVELYKNNNIDLYGEPLEIAVCAQHNNGGLAGDMWWESNIKGFFPVGEVNGTHGVYRPGGTALNSGQCGGLRAALRIVRERSDMPEIKPDSELEAEINGFIEKINHAAENPGKNSTVSDTKKQIGEYMSRYAAYIRDAGKMEEIIYITGKKIEYFWEELKIADTGELPAALSNRDLLIAQYVYLNAMLDYIKQGGVSRGSYLIKSEIGKAINDKLPFKYISGNDELNDKIQEITLTGENDEKTKITWRPRRPIPEAVRWFETVWNEYNKYL